MNDQEINIAIAEACGWKPHSELDNTWCAPHQSNCPLVANLLPLPKYTTDLNAMHEAEKMLTFSQQIIYGKFLHIVCDDATDVPDFDFMAPARQRAESLLKTIGKWKEGE